MIEPTTGMVEPVTPVADDDPDLLIDCCTAAVLLGLEDAGKPVGPRSAGVQVVRRLVLAKKLRATKLGRRWMTSRRWLNEYKAAASNQTDAG